MHDLVRRLKLAPLVVVAGAALIAVPAGLGTPPEQMDAPNMANVVPAGVGCPFAVRRVPTTIHGTTTTFSDGRVQTNNDVLITLTNLASGSSIEWRSVYRQLRTPGVDGNDDLVEINGQITLAVRPGDPHPLGGGGPALLGTIGVLRLTVNPVTGVRTSSSLDGQAVDLCALLAA